MNISVQVISLGKSWATKHFSYFFREELLLWIKSPSMIFRSKVFLALNKIFQWRNMWPGFFFSETICQNLRLFLNSLEPLKFKKAAI